MPNQPLTPADCARQGIPLPKGTTTLNAWHRSEDGRNVVRAHNVTQTSEKSAVDILDRIGVAELMGFGG